MEKFRLNGIALVAVLLLAITGCAVSPEKRSVGEKVDDVAISSRIKAALLGDEITDGLDIEIETFRGVVQLNGVADSDTEVARAGQIANGVKGVVQVSNNLIVRASRSVGEYVDDSVLKARVNGALLKNAETSAFQIDVEANRGTVMLGGFVASEAAKAAASEVVQRVSGVVEIRNNLQVRSFD